MPFPTLIMGLIAKERLKLLSGLTVVQRDYPIGAHTLTRSTAHIKGSKIGCTRYHCLKLRRREVIQRMRQRDLLLL